MTRRELFALPLLSSLTAAQAERAQRLHSEAIVINVHDHMWRASDIDDMRKGGVTAKIYKPMADGVYWDEKNRRSFPKDPFDWTAKYLEMAATIEGHSGAHPIRRVADIEEAKRKGGGGIILGNEGTLPLNGSIKGLDRLYERGLRELALYWPAGNHTAHVIDAEGHLTRFGQDVVARSNELGIVLDPSHLVGGLPSTRSWTPPKHL